MRTAIEDGEVKAIDLHDLLRRYMHYIADCEGVTFVDRLNDEAVSEVNFSATEVVFLHKISELIDR